MPSGDCSAAALFCFIVGTILDLPGVYLILPFVMCGRVYYHCHWFGDTIIGVLVGTFWGVLAYTQFKYAEPLAILIAGSQVFIPIS